jgi:hypothetical protein
VHQDTENILPFASISGKKVEADFDGGTVTSDGGVLFLRELESRIGIIQRLAGCLRDGRLQSHTRHTVHEMTRQRVFQIACGYEDANDCNSLRSDPAFKVACDRLPLSGEDLSSQPTMTRLENSATRTDLYRMAYALLDGFLASYPEPPRQIVLDLDDTDDPTHGAQQLSMFHGYYDEHCYLPLHIYEGQSGKLITTLLRPGRSLKGKQIVSILKRVVAYIRKAWPQVRILCRGDSGFSAPEVHDWCDDNGVYFVLGQAGNSKLEENGRPLLDQARRLHSLTGEKVRLFTSFFYQAGTWSKPRRIVFKAEVTPEGANPRFVVTNLQSSQASFLYDHVYCARGRVEGFIKNHKTYLRSDRTSCHKFTANQFRLFLHSAAYILMHALCEKGLKGTGWAKAQYDTIQKRILKVGARVRELSTRVKIHFPTSFPLKDVFHTIILNWASP